MIAMGIIVVLLSVPPAAAQGDPVLTLPENPHAFMKDDATCPSCHLLIDDVLHVDQVIVDIPTKCWECHSREGLGRSHPVGDDPRDAKYVIDVPDEFPLQDNKVTCASCHDSHGDWLSTIKCYQSQRPEVTLLEPGPQGEQVETLYYKTFYLRMSDPVEGFAPLCLACHRDR